MISRENAYRSVVAFMGSDASEGFDLTDAQAEELTKRLMMRVKVDVVLEPEATLPHASALFPPPDPDYVRRTTSQQKPKQTHEQAVAVITDFLNTKWGLVAPGCLLPTVSKINHAAFFDAVNAWAKQGGLIRADYLADIAASLFQRGALEKTPAPVEVVPPPPPPPPTPRELEQKRVKFERSLNDSSTSPIRGAKENARLLVPKSAPLTEEAKAALNEKAARDNAIVNEALSRISNFAGASHSRTYSGRVALREVFQAAMNEGKPAEEVLRAVEAEADRLAGNSSIR